MNHVNVPDWSLTRQARYIEFYIFNCEKKSVRAKKKAYNRGKQHKSKPLALLLLADYLGYERDDLDEIETTNGFIDLINSSSNAVDESKRSSYQEFILDIVDRIFDESEKDLIFKNPNVYHDILNFDVNAKSFFRLKFTWEYVHHECKIWELQKNHDSMRELRMSTYMRGPRNRMFDRVSKFSGYSTVRSLRLKKKDRTEEHQYPLDMTSQVYMDRALDDSVDLSFIDFVFSWFERRGVIHHTTSKENDNLVPYQKTSVWSDYEKFHPLVPYSMARIRLFDENGEMPYIDSNKFMESVRYFELANREDFKIYDNRLVVHEPEFNIELPQSYYDNPQHESSENMINFIAFLEDNFKYDPYKKVLVSDIETAYKSYLGDFAASSSTLYKMLGMVDKLKSTSVTRSKYGINGKSAYAGLKFRKESKVKPNAIHGEKPSFEYKAKDSGMVNKKVEVDDSNEEEKVSKSEVDVDSIGIRKRLNQLFTNNPNTFFPTSDILDEVGDSWDKSTYALGQYLGKNRNKLNIKRVRRSRNGNQFRGWIKRENN